MKKIVLSTSLLAFSIFLSNCAKKSNDPNPAIKQNQITLLTAHDWKPTSSFENNELLPVESCDIDDFATYFADGTAILNEGQEKCDTLATQTSSTTYFFSEDGKILHIKDPELGYVIPYTIITLTTTNMELQFTNPFPVAKYNLLFIKK